MTTTATTNADRIARREIDLPFNCIAPLFATVPIRKVVRRDEVQQQKLGRLQLTNVNPEVRHDIPTSPGASFTTLGMGTSAIGHCRKTRPLSGVLSIRT